MAKTNGILDNGVRGNEIDRKDEWSALKQIISSDQEEYWEDAANKLKWTKKWDKVCDFSDNPITKWFTGGKLSICYNCLDRQIENGFGDQEVWIYDSPVTGTKRTYTYKEIYNEITKLAGVIRGFGVKKGDLVLIYMPTIVETAFAMLACCRLGVIHCAMPGGLPAKDMAIRIDHAKPAVIMVASHGYHADGWISYKDIIDDACSTASHKVDNILVLRRTSISENINMENGRDVDWTSAVNQAQPVLECVPVDATDPLFIIYTSGSTGEPKGVVHPAGGYATRLISDVSNILLKAERESETIAATSSFAWIVGNTCLLYLPLLLDDAKAVIFEGDPLLSSDINVFFGLVQEWKITQVFVRPGLFKYLKAMDPDGKVASRYDLKSMRQISMGGERTDDGTLKWIAKVFDKATLLVMYSQTEITAALSVNALIAQEDCKPEIVFESFSFTGMDVVIMKSDGTVAEPNEIGRILIRLPLPPGGLITLFGNHERCKKTYFSEYPGYYDTKDEGYFDEKGALKIECRVDDVMKHGNVYLAAQAVEDIVASHPEVEECVVIAVPDLILKEVPVTLFTLEIGSGKKTNEERKIRVSNEIISRVSDHFGEAVKFGKAIAIKEMPRTRTGKIQRSTLISLGKGQKIQSLGAVENPHVLEDIARFLKKEGYGNI